MRVPRTRSGSISKIDLSKEKLYSMVLIYFRIWNHLVSVVQRVAGHPVCKISLRASLRIRFIVHSQFHFSSEFVSTTEEQFYVSVPVLSRSNVVTGFNKLVCSASAPSTYRPHQFQCRVLCTGYVHTRLGNI